MDAKKKGDLLHMEINHDEGCPTLKSQQSRDCKCTPDIGETLKMDDGPGGTGKFKRISVSDIAGLLYPDDNRKGK